MLFKTLFTVIILVISIAGFSKTFSYKHFSVEDGLPSSTVYDCVQDNDGYMWFATDRGVARFDGYEFEIFTTKNGLLENTIIIIHVDNSGRIWFASLNGTLCYYENEKISPYPYNNVLKNQDINSGLKQIFVTSEKLHIYTYRGGSFSINKLGKVEKDSTDYLNMFVVDDQMISFCDSQFPKTNYITLIGLDKNTRKIKIPNIQSEYNYFESIKTPGSNEIYFSIDKTLYRFRNGSVQQIYIAQKEIQKIKLVEEQIWLGTARDGLVILTPRKDSFISSRTLGSFGIREIFIDQEKSTWITTDEDGVYFMPSTKHYVLTKEDGISSNNIWKMVGSKETLIWIDLAGAVNELMIANDNTSVIKKIENGWLFDIVYQPYDEKFIIIQAQTLKEAKIDKEKYLLIEGSKKIVAIDTNYSSAVEATGDGFRVTHYKKETAFVQLFPTADSMKWWNIKCVRYKDEQILVGTDKGLYSLSLSLKDSVSKPIYWGNYHPLFKKKIIDIDENAKHDLFFVTGNDGIITLKNGKIGIINESLGLASNSITSIFIDSTSSIWVSTLNGISVIDTNDIIKNITVQDGLISNQTNSIYANSEKVYVGTNRGLSVINRQHIKKDTIDIPVIFKSISLENNKQLTPSKNSIDLAYNQPILNIKYVGISYKSMGRIKYRYRFNEFENWQNTRSTELLFANLTSGSYSLEIQVSNDDNNWSSKSAILQINVAYPFWRSVGFIIAIIFGSTFILFGIYRFSLFRVKRREATKRQVQNLRFEALNAQMNPHFIFNSLNSIQHFIMTNDKRESTRYLSKFAKLMRKTLDHSQEQNITLKEELEALTLYLELEALRFDNLITYEIIIAPTVDKYHVLLPALLIQPIVENAILHGLRPKKAIGHIKISIENEKAMLFITIVDNGVGREIATQEKSDQHDSKGCLLTKERVLLFSKDYNAESDYRIIDLYANEKPNGTEVKIKIPLILKVSE
ncbi:MAG: ligand-binding sensor domain-containing protein [Crocinitomix sp.]